VLSDYRDVAGSDAAGHRSLRQSGSHVDAELHRISNKAYVC
ncbi:MAG: hypothetical protein Q605_AUC01167G0002, partial [Actinomyces urogenitalis DORA_12]